MLGYGKICFDTTFALILLLNITKYTLPIAHRDEIIGKALLLLQTEVSSRDAMEVASTAI